MDGDPRGNAAERVISYLGATLLSRLGGAAFLLRNASGRKVVLKVATDPPAKACLKREAEFLSRCQNKAWPTYLDYASLGGSDWLLTDWIDGEKLSAGALPQNWLKAAETALSDLHRLGFIHGDIKPGNLLVSGSNIRLIDFGACLPAGVSWQQTTYSCASPGYASVNALARSGFATPADDYISLAHTLAAVTPDTPLPARYQLLLTNEQKKRR